MTKPLIRLPASDGPAVLAALIDALAGGPALHVFDPGQAAALPLPEAVPDEVALVVGSSGSSGRPKAVALGANALLSSAKASTARLGGGAWLLALPLHYIAGLNVLLRAVQVGHAPLFMNLAVGFDPEGFARSSSLLPAGARFTSLVPSQLQGLLRAAETDAFVREQLTSFEAILVGGQSLEPRLIERAQGLGVRLVESYGMTETCGGALFDGLPLEGVEAEVSNGRIRLRGSVLALGYLAAAGELAPLPLVEGWFETNDLGEQLGDGRIKPLGRADRTFASGGVKLSLDLLEETASLLLPGRSVAAVAGPDADFGARPVLFVSRASEAAGQKELPANLRKQLKEKLGVAASRVGLHELEQIPYLSSGKVDYQRLTELASNGLATAD